MSCDNMANKNKVTQFKFIYTAIIYGPSQTLNIIANDFNEIFDLELDKSTYISRNNVSIAQQYNVLHQLHALGFKNTFRLINNDQKAFIYKHSKGKNEEPTYTRIDMLWMKGPENIIINWAYIILSKECTDSDHDILITRIYTAEFLVNNRRHTRRIAFNQSRVAATKQIVNERHEKQKCRNFVNSLSLQLKLIDTRQAIDQFLYSNSDIRADNEDATEDAIESQEQLLNIINSCWSQITAGIDEAINSHLRTRMSSIHRTKQTNRKLIDYIAANTRANCINCSKISKDIMEKFQT
ncbi:hypothetical protein RclHR1_02130002 [Rhizophagus clarus]|uniref:Endonuclease/exonuclease/phosphatase domain-containing protein n=1 Tax=Rhizophagus clarus TaxID=94130 RepID=A0A2Z6R5J8_9GLOM|nr:hypothetical protein RclHR1_02130002 [Rhizophagus clarus]